MTATLPIPPHFALRHQPRRLRRRAAMRAMLRETQLQASDFLLPIFLVEGTGVREEIASMPGVFRHSIDSCLQLCGEAVARRIPGVLLFGVVAAQCKDASGSASWDSNGLVQRATRAIREHYPDLLVIADACFCEYTDHGHCGVLAPDGDRDDPATLENLQRQALSYAEAGVDVIAPSGMVDGMVLAIREALDAARYERVAVLSYAIKYASAFYGPFRDAADSAPSFGDRRAYQMDPANRREAFRELALDLEEGADMVMVKPAMPYLDILRDVRERCDFPVLAYQVSGEYSMLRAAAAAGALELQRSVLESLLAIKRAGADAIISYFAIEVADWLD
ncbi:MULTISPECIES: porphobilinogen synthase [Acidithiobacillus]|jgi:porphobilinogen synthase|uniref:Delta-aminolevulinic acid dehydratase n=4 Tax=Acidithiobacillus caldus TaxID=33059 RepID=F9ZTX1_ACICS|nr:MULTISPECIES: porphobilinogen synthase [Acidithiobacillus]AEK59455.1 Porphobilinogen synthase [Acidithiobacillus caldus SM-1]AIA56498.1 Porphobilinogen synthase [Acidithiobacillus caldus ATCC 51756]AUW33820.1 porphobilinogen synthase [Acidithiobacillus caldus]MBU2730603.1 porphobilinogen synthase [Acidithiobacillus caldus]MBU2735550.1 porphobilinogen synthase [Acidithiobacillus caldus ATCC 51756]